LIVVRQDKAAVPALKQLALKGKSPLGRLHALWTLDGLGSLENSTIAAALKDTDARVRSAAIRVSEAELAKGNASLIEMLKKMARDDSDIEVAIQLVLSAGYTGAEGIAEAANAAHPENEALKRITDIGKARAEDAQRRRLQGKLLAQGELNFKTICVACHGLDGKGTEAPGLAGVTLGAPLVGSPRLRGRKDIPIRILLKGMHGELDGKAYPGPMLPLESFDDGWLASVLTYVRNSWGNKAPAITADDVASVRASIVDRKEMYLTSEILAMTPLPKKEMKTWTLTASHNQSACANAIDGKEDSRWDTNAVQADGMWFAFDMKEERVLNSITLRCEGSSDDYPRRYSVEVSADGESWNQIVAPTVGTSPVTDILFPSIKTRHVRITQLGQAEGKFWSIHQLEVFASPKA
jgi:mono/diheme cytochrome c family protein